MAIPSKEYWAERAIQREQESAAYGARATAKLFREYERAAKQIQKEISSFYAKYGNKYGLSYEDAVRLLTRSEFRDWRGTLADYMEQIAQAQDATTKALLTAQLDALSANSQISRLEALQGQISLILGDLYDRGVQQMKDEFGDTFVQSYYKKSFDIQSRAGFFNEIAKIDAGIIEDAVTYPWSGANFSERLWKNTNALIFGSREILTQGLIQGKSVPTMAKSLSSFMGQSYKAAERLIRTETNNFHNQGELRAYQAHGVLWYEYMAGLDERTCEVCGGLDGQHFKVDDAVAGTNYPPMHPNCRCTTVEWDPEDEADWAASGLEMPKTTSYKEWYDEQVARNGQGSVEIERKKAYNITADKEQYSNYIDRLGDDAPSTFEEFQTMKYQDPDEWKELKSFYSYKGRVAEATKNDFKVYTAVKATGIYGTVRVPPAPVDVSSLAFDAAHVALKHDATESESRSYIETALFSLKRKHQSGKTFTNYYSSDGASYVYDDGKLIRTAFKRTQFDKKTERAVKEAENAI
jgi:SPP1 gp7 family putative phage head morphogenesis protein